MADLHHLGRAEGRRRAAELLERFDLVEAATKPAATYSGGMRRRLDLAMTLVGDPRIIFLDEPTTGLDPRSRRTMWQIIRDLVGRRRHDLPHHPVPGGGRPARRPDRGARPRASWSPRAPPDELKRLVPGGHIRLRFADASELESAARALGERRAATTTSSPCRSRATAASGRCGPCSTGSTPTSIDVDELSVHTPDLDDVFLALTGAPRHREGASSMSTLSYAVTDSATMLRRQLRHMLRYPSMTVMLVGMPIVFLLLFVYVFGGTLGAGLGGSAAAPAAAPSTSTTSRPGSS